jgi:hypothetical protein
MQKNIQYTEEGGSLREKKSEIIITKQWLIRRGKQVHILTSCFSKYSGYKARSFFQRLKEKLQKPKPSRGSDDGLDEGKLYY